MRRYIGLIILYFITHSCGMLMESDVTNGNRRQFESTNPIFNEYVAKFERDGKVLTQDQSFSIGDIPINFGDTKNPRFDGLCIKYPNGDREVLMKKSWWDRSSKDEREILLYHELGHCRLNRSHDEHKVHNTKTSIMNPVVPNVLHYMDYRTQYVQELFTGNKTQIMDAISI